MTSMPSRAFVFKNCQGWSVSVNRHKVPYRRCSRSIETAAWTRLKAARAWRDEIVQTVPMTLVECSNQSG